jgi:amphi-Trp domain-containing protein
MSKKEVKLKGIMDPEQIVSYLEDLVGSLKQGKICVQQGEQFVTLNPDQAIHLEVKASVKKGKEKFVMELAWRKEEPADDDQEMRISPDEPEGDEADEDKGALPAVSGPAIEGTAGEGDADGQGWNEQSEDEKK